MQIYSGFWNKSANGMMKRLSEQREHMVIWSSSLRVNTFKSLLLLRIHELVSWMSCVKTADIGSVTDAADNGSVVKIK